jgi:hypothetical protein
MSWSEDSRSEYKGFEVFTSLVSFGSTGWTARYSIVAKRNDAGNRESVHRSEVTERSDRADLVLAAARAAAYGWIDQSERSVATRHRG